MIVLAIRAIILYFLVIVMMRMLGKRQIGQLQPYELVFAIIVAELIAAPMQDIAAPLLSGVIPLLTLFAVELILAYLSLKSETVRKVVCGTPSVVIEHGKIVESQLARSRLNINDLIEQLRIKGYPSVSDVEFAILETAGHLSVIPKAAHKPLTPSDMKLSVGQEVLPVTLILDGKLNKENMNKAGLSEEKVLRELRKKKIKRVEDVFFASLEGDGNFFIQKKTQAGGRR